MSWFTDSFGTIFTTSNGQAPLFKEATVQRFDGTYSTWNGHSVR